MKCVWTEHSAELRHECCFLFFFLTLYFHATHLAFECIQWLLNAWDGKYTNNTLHCVEWVRMILRSHQRSRSFCFVSFAHKQKSHMYRTVYIEFFIPTKWYSLTHTNANCVLKPQHKHLCAVIFSTNLPFKFRFILFYHHQTINPKTKYSLEIKKNRKPSAAFV